jgi:hypothetical protein
MSKMDDDKLIGVIEDHEGNAETYGELSEDRTRALDYYLGEPMGNEVEGRSQVISRQVWDVVEWIKPQLADIFTSGEEVVEFKARGPEDMKGAEQETDYINHVITEKNNWFEVFYSWSHDALIQKNGYVKAYFDDSEDTIQEAYQGLTDDEFALLSQDKGIEIVEYEEVVMVDQMGMPVRTHSVRLKRAKPRNITKIENLAPEFVLVSQNAKGLCLQDPSVDFVEHREYKTISQLREQGFDVDDDITDSGDGSGDWEEHLRDDNTPFRDVNRDGAGGDGSMRRVKVRECWVRVDYDGDGMAELRHVIVVGREVLLNEDCDIVPIVALCPTPLAHRHYGLSVADAVMDLQRIQTALLRGALDNQYLANNGRYGINVNSVNMDDMLDSRAGGVVRVDGPLSEAFFPLTHPTNGGQVVPMMEYMDKIAQRRTGVSEQSMGLNPNALNNQAGAIANTAMMTAAQQRIKFIARVMAETGVKSLFLLVHALEMKHSRQQKMVELRGEWVPVDPRQWTKRTDMRVSVGIGAGDKPQQITFLTQLIQSQVGMLQMRLTSPEKIYNSLSRITKLAGYKDPNEFWQNPAKLPPAQPQPDPKMLIEQMKQQADIQRFQAEQQMTAQIEQIKAQAKLQEVQANLELQAANDMRDGEREQMQAQLKAEIEQMKIQSDQQIKSMELEMDRYKADLDSQTKLAIAQMSTQASIEAKAGEQAVQSGQALAGEMGGQIEQMAQAMLGALDSRTAQLKQMLDQISAASSAPKRIVRDSAGKAVGVEVNGVVRPIERGPDGRALGY